MKWYLLMLMFLLGVSWCIPLAIYSDTEVHPFILNKSVAIWPEVYVNYLMNHLVKTGMAMFIYWQNRNYVTYVFMWCFVFFTAQYIVHYNGVYPILDGLEITSHLFVFIIFAWVVIKSGWSQQDSY